MSSEKTESILRICRRDGRYAPQAYYFVFDALDYTIQRMNKMRHVTGRELLDGVRLYATENFGFLNVWLPPDPAKTTSSQSLLKSVFQAQSKCTG